MSRDSVKQNNFSAPKSYVGQPLWPTPSLLPSSSLEIWNP